MGSQRVGISDAFHDGREEEEMGKIHRRLSNEESPVPPLKKKKERERERETPKQPTSVEKQKLRMNRKNEISVRSTVEKSSVKKVVNCLEFSWWIR